MSTFKAAIGVCGLSQQEAADFLQVSLSSVKQWCNGRNNPPRGVWQLLASLFDQIQESADGAAEVMHLEGIDPRAWNNLAADIVGDELPNQSALAAAGAMALLMAITEMADEKSPAAS